MHPTYFPSVRREGNGFVAGVHDDRQQRYEIIPLGEERDRTFYSERAAEELSEKRATALTERQCWDIQDMKLGGFPSMRRV